MKVKVKFGVLSCEVLQSTEKVSWDTQNKPSHAHPTGCQMELTTGVVWQKAEHKHKAWHQENFTGKWHSSSGLHIPSSSSPSALLPTSERGNALSYFYTYQLLEESGIILS